MLKITTENYAYYKQAFAIIWEFQAAAAGIDPAVPHSPINVLSGWEQEQMSIARKGLKEGLRDSLTMVAELPDDMKQSLDKRMTGEGFTSLNKLLAMVRDIPAKVLKRGKIRNLDEYYVIKEVLDDATYDITAAENMQLNTLFAEFEQQYKRKGT